jgi:pantetheine-phosphate adenylyltransferase
MRYDIQPLLERWGISMSSEEIWGMWNAPSRKYHAGSHLLDLFHQIASAPNLSQNERDMLELTAIFHDIVYDPTRDDNEEQSTRLFQKRCPFTEDAKQIADMILDTQHHAPKSPLSKLFCKMDMAIVEAPFGRLLEWEDGIRYEYGFLDEATYLKRRVTFLESMCFRYPHNAPELRKLIAHIQTPNNDYDIVLEYHKIMDENNISDK